MFESLLFSRRKILILCNNEKVVPSICSRWLPCRSSDFRFMWEGNLYISVSKFPLRFRTVRFLNFFMTSVSKNTREELAINNTLRWGNSLKSCACILEILLCDSNNPVVYSGIPRGTLSRFCFSQCVSRVLLKHRHEGGHDSIHVTHKYINTIIISMFFAILIFIAFLSIRMKNFEMKCILFRLIGDLSLLHILLIDVRKVSLKMINVSINNLSFHREWFARSFVTIVIHNSNHHTSSQWKQSGIDASLN
jgi:hypothetical protein